MTFNIVFAIFLPLTILAEEALLSIIPTLNNPHFGVMISIIAIAGLLALFPLEYLLSRRGFTVWPVPQANRGSGQITLPSIRDSWWILLITLAILLGVLAWTISQLG